MEIRVFIGAHRTSQEHLRTQLENNRDLLESHGTLMPPEDVAENALWSAIKAVRKNKADEQTGPNMIDQLTQGKTCERVLVIRPAISGSPVRPTKNGNFYPRGNTTVQQLMRAIEDVETRLYLATRNPATFLPSCYGMALGTDQNLTFADFTSPSNPYELRWSEYLHRLQEKAAETPITTWSFEDYPYIWRSVAQAFSGISNKEDLIGTLDNIDQGMSLRGATLMHAFLAKQPPQKSEDLQRISAKFEDRFPPDSADTVVDLWPDDLVSGLTDAYDDDIYYIDRMDNITTIRKPEYS